MTPEEKAELASLRRFPHDERLQKLAAKEYLENLTGKPLLTAEEKAELLAIAQFPAENLSHARDLAYKESLITLGQNCEFPAVEKAELLAIRQFPDNKRGQELALKEILAVSGGSQLTSAEREELKALRKNKSSGNSLANILHFS